MRPFVASLLNADLLEDMTTEERMTIYRRVMLSVRGMCALLIFAGCIVMAFWASGYVNWSSLLILPAGFALGFILFNRVIRRSLDRHAHTMRPSCCPTCGHWMGKDTSGTCPECGHRSMQASVHDELERGRV